MTIRRRPAIEWKTNAATRSRLKEPFSMTLRHRLAIEPMTRRVVRPLRAGCTESSGMPDDRQGHDSRHEFECDGRVTIHTIWQPRARAGRSPGSSATSASRRPSFSSPAARAVVCAAPPTDLDDPGAIPLPEDVRAFLIDPGQGVLLRSRHLALAGPVRARPAGGDVRDSQLSIRTRRRSSTTRTGPRCGSRTSTWTPSRPAPWSIQDRRSNSRSEPRLAGDRTRTGSEARVRRSRERLRRRVRTPGHSTRTGTRHGHCGNCYSASPRS